MSPGSSPQRAALEALAVERPARLVDHTLLAATATRGEVERLCDEALEHGFASVCINPVWISETAARLRGSEVAVCTVVGFPLGADGGVAKAAAAARAFDAGAREVDMVIDLGGLLSGDLDRVGAELEAVVATRPAGGLVKVILETAALDDRLKRVACGLARSSGADYVKTSTGFGPGGATAADVALLRDEVGEEMGVKASGGIRSHADLLAMVRAGASRIGSSAGVAIVREATR